MRRKQKPPDLRWDSRVSGTTSDYFDDPLFAKKQSRLKRMREAYREKRDKEILEMENQTIHWLELARLKRAIGQLEGIVRMIEQGDPRCREISYQLKSVSTVTRKIALHILRRHQERCLSDENWEGSEEGRLKEMELTAKAMLSLIEEIREISKNVDPAEEKIFEELEDKFEN